MFIRQTEMIDDLSGIIERLDKAIKICYEAERMPGHDGYAYAAGYSRAIMMDTIEEIKALIHMQAK